VKIDICKLILKQLESQLLIFGNFMYDLFHSFFVSNAFDIFNIVVLGYFVLINSFYLIMSIFSFFSLKKYAIRLKSVDIDNLVATAGAPPITLIAPAYNEELNCVDSIQSLLTLKYPDYEIFIVNDGSSDGTLQTIINNFHLKEAYRVKISNIDTQELRAIYHSKRYPNLWLFDKENGGKADALNVGINYANSGLFCAIDADSLVERDALMRIVRPFLEDNTTVAAGGIIRIVNGCSVKNGSVTKVRLPDDTIAQFQVIEYLRAFLAGRVGWDAIGATLIISGAFGLFKRASVVAVGGYSVGTVGEDMELVVKLHMYHRDRNLKYKIAFIPDPVAWTECPESLSILGRQRDRWQRGLIQSLWKYKRALFNPKFGALGFVAFPYFFFLEMLGPIVEFLGYIVFFVSIAMGMVNSLYMISFFFVAILFGIIISVSAIALEELTFRRYPSYRDLLKLFLLAILENFGYRQLSSYWRIKGVFSQLLQKKGWGKMIRKGFKTTS